MSKVYRAFEELDRFSDDECIGFVKTAERVNRWTRVVVLGIVGLCFLPGGCIGGGLGIGLTNIVFGEVSAPDWRLGVALIFMVVGVGIPTVGGLVLRDVWLRSAVRKQLGRCACPVCDYSMLGLQPTEGAVVCPECGTRHTLSRLGLSNADILVPMLDPNPLSEPGIHE